MRGCKKDGENRNFSNNAIFTSEWLYFICDSNTMDQRFIIY